MTDTRVPEAKLRSVVTELFAKMGVSPQDSAIAADVLLSADLRGVESHGVSNMLRKYVRDYRAGILNPAPKWNIIRESVATATIDADKGLGIIIGPKAMEIAIEKAKQAGIGMVTIKNSGHMGMVGYYAMQALAHDMIGMAMTSGRPSVLPTFGAEPRLGTNPIALAAPALTKAPFVFDAATSVISGNKVGLAQRLGAKLGPGLVADKNGSPLMREVDIKEVDPANPLLLPLGGTRELGSHKGYGLSAIVEILTGILAGAGSSLGRNDFSHTVVAYRIDAFMDIEAFKKEMDEWLGLLESTAPAPGQERVIYAGLMEAEVEADRRANGIPLHKEVVEWFSSICQELSIEPLL